MQRESGAVVECSPPAVAALQSSDVPYLSEWAVFVHPDCRRSGHAAVLHPWLKMQVEMTRMPMIPRHHGAVAPGGEVPIDRRRFSKVGEFFIHTPPFLSMPGPI